MYKKLFIVFILGFSSGLPLALVSSTLQAWFATTGFPVWGTGLLSLVGLPYLLRFLWSPFLDRYRLFGMGRRRDWIFLMQLLLCIGFQMLTWFSPTISPAIMAIIALMLAACSATQDAAIDAHRAEYLPLSLHGLGASLAILGYRLALLVAGGLALIIAQHTDWIVTYRIMSGLMLLGMIAVIFSSEPSRNAVQPLVAPSFSAPFKELLLRPDIGIFCLFVLFYKFGEAFTTSTSGIIMPFLIQGMGFSLDTIGYVNKIGGIIASLLGGLVGGVILMRYSLYYALILFGLLQSFTNVIFIALAYSSENMLLLVVAVVSDNFVAGMASTALLALFMRSVHRGFTATQLSILIAVAGIPRVFSGPIGAFLQALCGWGGFYTIAFVISLAFMPFLYRLRFQRFFQVKSDASNQT